MITFFNSIKSTTAFSIRQGFLDVIFLICRMIRNNSGHLHATSEAFTKGDQKDAS